MAATHISVVSPPRVLAIIPARIGSTRLAHKLLIEIDGKTVLARTLDQVLQCTAIDKVVVAADDPRLVSELSSARVDILITEGDYSCGTERCASVIDRYPNHDIIINVQGDQPYIAPSIINALAHKMSADPAIGIASLMTDQPTSAEQRQVVKVQVDQQGVATSFDRGLLDGDQYHHIGVYGFRRKVLSEVAQLPPSALELKYHLEQLRWMEHGIPIHMVAVDHQPHSIDVADDLNQSSS